MPLSNNLKKHIALLLLPSLQGGVMG